MKLFLLPRLSMMIVSIAILTVSCAFVFEDKPKTYDGNIYLWPESTAYQFRECDSDQTFDYCGKRDRGGHDYSWQANCHSDRCRAVQLFVHFRLMDNLGTQTSLWVEAFDNPYFNGRALASLRIGNFDASFPNSSPGEEIYLEPGEYYLRAFISPRNDSNLPPDLQGLEPAQGALGAFGALSAPERVVVSPRGTIEPINIQIDRLYQDPNHQIDTQAKIRVEMTIDQEIIVPNNRNVMVELRSEPNLEQIPLYQFSVDSNQFLVPGSLGQSELLTPSLKIDDYYLLVFIDQDNNKLYDWGELAGYLQKFDEPYPIKVREQAIKTVLLELELFPRLP